MPDAANMNSGVDRQFCKRSAQGATSLRNISQMRRDKHYCDVTLIVCDEKIHAHKAILASTIPYFRALLLSNMQEAHMSEIKLNNLNVDMVRKVVDFAYSGRVTYTKSSVQDLLVVANFFDVQAIRKECCDFLINRMNEENVVDIFMLGQQLGESSLCSAAVPYACCPKFADLANTDFLNMPSEFLKEILKNELLMYVGQDLKFQSPANQEYKITERILEYVNYDRQSRLRLLPDFLSLLRLPTLQPTDLNNLTCNTLVQSSPEALAIAERAKKTKAVHRGYCLEHAEENCQDKWHMSRSNFSLSSLGDSVWMRYWHGMDPRSHFYDKRVLHMSETIVTMTMWFAMYTPVDVIPPELERLSLIGIQSLYNSGRVISHIPHLANTDTCTCYTFDLLPGEFISGVKVIGHICLHCVWFETSEGRILGPYGEQRDISDEDIVSYPSSYIKIHTVQGNYLFGFQGTLLDDVIGEIAGFWVAARADRDFYESCRKYRHEQVDTMVDKVEAVKDPVEDLGEGCGEEDVSSENDMSTDTET